jgi:hypothetical protein
MPGAPADRAPDTRTADAADSLAAFLTALHRPAPDGAPIARRREEHNYGGRLAERAEQFAEQLASATELRPIPNPDAVLAMWEDAVAAPGRAGPARSTSATSARAIRPATSLSWVCCRTARQTVRVAPLSNRPD